MSNLIFRRNQVVTEGTSDILIDVRDEEAHLVAGTIYAQDGKDPVFTPWGQRRYSFQEVTEIVARMEELQF